MLHNRGSRYVRIAKRNAWLRQDIASHRRPAARGERQRCDKTRRPISSLTNRVVVPITVPSLTLPSVVFTADPGIGRPRVPPVYILC
jgi:hypothetical protein